MPQLLFWAHNIDAWYHHLQDVACILPDRAVLVQTMPHSFFPSHHHYLLPPPVVSSLPPPPITAHRHLWLPGTFPPLSYSCSLMNGPCLGCQTPMPAIESTNASSTQPPDPRWVNWTHTTLPPPPLHPHPLACHVMMRTLSNGQCEHPCWGEGGSEQGGMGGGT